MFMHSLQRFFQSSVPVAVQGNLLNPSDFESGLLRDPDVIDTTKLQGARILLVEDELLVAMDMEMAFEKAGAEVVGPVGSLKQAMKILDQEPVIDAAVLDINLAGVNVFPVADVLKARNVPFLFHTGHGIEADLAHTFPAVPVISKPVLQKMLVAAVASIML